MSSTPAPFVYPLSKRDEFLNFYAPDFTTLVPANMIVLPSHLSLPIYYPQAKNFNPEHQLDTKWWYVETRSAQEMPDFMINKFLVPAEGEMILQVPTVVSKYGVPQFQQGFGKKAAFTYDDLPLVYDPRQVDFERAIQDCIGRNNRYFRQKFPDPEQKSMTFPKGYARAVNPEGNIPFGKRLLMVKTLDSKLVSKIYFKDAENGTRDQTQKILAPSYFSHANPSDFRIVVRKTSDGQKVIHIYFNVNKFKESNGIYQIVFKGLSDALLKRFILKNRVKTARDAPVEPPFFDDLFTDFSTFQKSALSWMISSEEAEEPFSYTYLENCSFMRFEETLPNLLIDFDNLVVVSGISGHYQDKATSFRGGILGYTEESGVSADASKLELRKNVTALILMKPLLNLLDLKMSTTMKSMMFPSKATLIVCQSNLGVNNWFNIIGIGLKVCMVSNIEEYLELSWKSVMFADVVLLDLSAWQEGPIRQALEQGGKSFETRYPLAGMPDIIRNKSDTLNKKGAVDLEGFFYHRVVYEEFGADESEDSGRTVNPSKNQFSGTASWLIMDLKYEGKIQQKWIALLNDAVKSPMEEVAFMKNYSRSLANNSR